MDPVQANNLMYQLKVMTDLLREILAQLKLHNDRELWKYKKQTKE